MSKVHFRVPVTLDVSVSVDTADATDTHAKKWRPWPKDAHESMQRGEWLLVRFLSNGDDIYSFEVAYFNGWDLVNGVGQTLFLPEGCTLDDLDEDCANDDLVYRYHMPEGLTWIPLVELLKDVEEQETAQKEAQE